MVMMRSIRSKDEMIPRVPKRVEYGGQLAALGQKQMRLSHGRKADIRLDKMPYK